MSTSARVTAKGVFQVPNPTISDEEQVLIDAAKRDNASRGNRAYRDQLLNQSDWTQVPDSPLTDEKKAEWATYRTSLRNLPDHENWPYLEDADWPTEPS